MISGAEHKPTITSHCRVQLSVLFAGVDMPWTLKPCNELTTGQCIRIYSGAGRTLRVVAVASLNSNKVARKCASERMKLPARSMGWSMALPTLLVRYATKTTHEKRNISFRIINDTLWWSRDVLLVKPSLHLHALEEFDEFAMSKYGSKKTDDQWKSNR